MRLNSFQQIVRSLYRNLAKGKFYAIFRVFWDKEYRAEIQHMRMLTRQYDLVLGHGSIPLRAIVRGHKINYPNWVNHLVDQINTRGWKKLEPIKVIWDKSKFKWLVVDGNHRLEAMKRTLPSSMKIPVFILRPSDLRLSDYQKEIIDQIQQGRLPTSGSMDTIEVRNVYRKDTKNIQLGVPYKKEKRNV